MSVILEESPNQTGLAFVLHGLGGYKEQPHIEAFADAFKEHGMSVVRFDARDTLGESEGSYEYATVSGYVEDLEDVINWASTQLWYQEPFWLCGHSFGSFATILYAEKYPEKIAGLAPISTVISGKVSLTAPQYTTTDKLNIWKKTGWRINKSESVPGLIKKLPWSHMEDRLKYDVLPEADKLTMPLFLLTSSADQSCPPEHQQLLFDAAPEPKEFHIIEGAPHTYKQPEHIAEVKQTLSKWIQKYLNT